MKSSEGKARIKRRPVFLASGLLLLFFLNPGLSRSESGNLSTEKTETRWYRISLEGETIGYIKEMVFRVKENGQWRWKSVSESKIMVSRLGRKIEMSLKAEHTEGEDGRLEKIVTEQELASSRVKNEIEILAGKIQVITVTGEQTFRREIPYEGRLLGPVGIGLLTSEKLRAPGDKIEYQTFLPELSRVVSGERELVVEEEVECGEMRATARKVVEKISPMVTSREIWLDAGGNEIKAVESSPFGQLVVCLASEREVKEALALASAQERFFQSSLIKSSIRLPQSRQLERVVLRLHHRRPELGWPDLENEYQRIVDRKENTLVLGIKRVNIREKAGEKTLPEDLEPFLGSNTYINASHPEIRKLAARIAAREKDPLKKALKLRDWVAKNLTFDPGFVFAPASEVLRDKKATCAGYAALLAALLRASRIPSTFVIGLAYVSGVWGGHAWVEAGLKGRWVPLDAALPSPGAADASRLAIHRSSLENGLSDSLIAAQKFFGYVTVEVLEFKFQQHAVKVLPGQPIFEIKDGRYWNHGLQLGLRAPAGFNFTDTDKVWPDRTLLTLTGPGGEKVRIFQESWFPAENPEQALVDRLKKEVFNGRVTYFPFSGRKHPVLISEKVSAAAVLNGVDLFIIVARSESSRELLFQVLDNLEIRLVVAP
ncbi:MAG: transglutaminase-like domain-containing protein [Candidatus Saccharicenans sp.]